MMLKFCISRRCQNVGDETEELGTSFRR